MAGQFDLSGFKPLVDEILNHFNWNEHTPTPPDDPAPPPPADGTLPPLPDDHALPPLADGTLPPLPADDTWQSGLCHHAAGHGDWML